MYKDDLHYATQLVVALEYIIDKVLEHPTTYPLLMRAYIETTHGIQPRIAARCPCGRTLGVTTDRTIGGLHSAIRTLEEAIKWLEMEVENEEEPVYGDSP